MLFDDHAFRSRNVGHGAKFAGFRLDLGQAKVEDLGVAALRHEDVGRFDVAMHDALGVGRVKGICDLNAQG